MPEFTVTTQEHVVGTYKVEADSALEAELKFARHLHRSGALIDWEGVEQTDYMAYDVEVEKVECPDCGITGERVLNPSWPNGDEPAVEKCPTCT